MEVSAAFNVREYSEGERIEVNEMSSGILEEIEKRIRQVQEETGMYPDYVVLGFEEYSRLMNEVPKELMPTEAVTSSRPVTVFGLRLYRSEKRSEIQIGFDFVEERR